MSGCVRCKRSLPQGETSSLCKRCVARDQSRAAVPAPDRPAQPPAAPAAEPPTKLTATPAAQPAAPAPSAAPEPDRKDHAKSRSPSTIAAPGPASSGKVTNDRSGSTRNALKRASREQRRQ